MQGSTLVAITEIPECKKWGLKGTNRQKKKRGKAGKRVKEKAHAAFPKTT